VSLVVKKPIADAGVDPTGFSGHSLRAGYAVKAGISTLKIRAQTGHASDAMLARYVRDGELLSTMRLGCCSDPAQSEPIVKYA